jgi:MFS family permease
MTASGRLGRRASGGLGGNYWKLWISSGAANLADGVFWIAFPLFAIQLTTSPVLIAGVTVVGRLPWLLFVLVAGALADRLDRRRTMVAVAVVRTVIAAGLAVGIYAGVVNLPILYVTVFVLGVGETLFDTAAQSIMPSIVERDQLSTANGRLYAAELTMNQFVGPPLGGLLSGIAIALAFAGSAAAFAVGAIGLFLLAGSFHPSPGARDSSIVDDIREGLGYLRRHVVLRTLAVMVGAMNLASSAIFAIMVLYVVTPGPMGLNEVQFGLLMTAMAVGSLLGSLFAARVERWIGRAPLLVVAVVVGAATMVVPGLTTSPILVGVAFAIWGAFVVMWNVVTVSLRQRIVPDRLLGRINASYRLLAWGTQPLGALLGGIVAELVSLEAVFILAGLGTAILVILNRILTEDALSAAERRGEEEARAELSAEWGAAQEA